jgi:hypothetical protein
MATATTTTWTVDIKPGDVFALSCLFDECIIITEVSEEGVMYEDYDGNEGCMGREPFEPGTEEGWECPSPWQRLTTDHQQFWGWRLIELWAEFNDLESNCKRLNGLIRAAKNADRHDREWRLMMRQRELAQGAMAKRREIRRAVDLLRFSIEN